MFFFFNINNNCKKDLKCSGYSSGCPPGSNAGPCVAVPISANQAMQKLTFHLNYLIVCHELWDQADHFVIKGKHKGKFIIKM